MDPAAVRTRIEEHVRRHELIEPGGEVCCLVSGGADSTCLWHALRELGYRITALHVDHLLRGRDSDEDARFCRERLGAEVIEARRPRSHRGTAPRAPLFGGDRPAARDRAHGIRPGGDDPLPPRLARQRDGHRGSARRRRRPPAARRLARRHECLLRGRGAWRSATDASNADTKRGLIRDRILPLLRELHPAADENLLRALDTRETLPPALAELLSSPTGSKRVDLGGGLQAVREYERVWLEHGPVDLDGEVAWGPWRIRSELPGLKVRGWRPGDRLAGRAKKIQDVFVDAKIPRSEREAWPLVVRGDEVVAVPGIVDAPGRRGEGRGMSGRG